MMEEGINVGKRSGRMSAVLEIDLNGSDSQCGIVVGQTRSASGLGIGEEAQERKSGDGCKKKHHDDTLQTLSLGKPLHIVPASMLHSAHSWSEERLHPTLTLSVLFGTELKGRSRPLFDGDKNVVPIMPSILWKSFPAMRVKDTGASAPKAISCCSRKLFSPQDIKRTIQRERPVSRDTHPVRRVPSTYLIFSHCMLSLTVSAFHRSVTHEGIIYAIIRRRWPLNGP